MPGALRYRRWPLGLTACATLLLTVLPGLAPAASCCGGASATDPFVLPKWNRGLAGALLQLQTDVDQRDAAGERLNVSSWRSHEQRLVAGGAWRVATHVQLAASLPLVLHTVTSFRSRSFGAGVGDVGLQVRYELIDEETCVVAPFRQLNWRSLKPSLHWVVKQTLPTGRSPAQAKDALGASTTGRGAWVTDTGIDLTKIWGLIGNSLELTGGYQAPTAAESAGGSAIRFGVGGSLLLYPAYQRFVGVNVSHQQERWRDAGRGRRTSTALGLIGSYVLAERGIWLRASLGSTGWVQGRSAPVGMRANLFVAKLFS